MSSSAITSALACESATPQTDGNARNSGSTMWAMAGSPSQPSARLVRVLATWVVAMVWLRFSIACRTATAPKRPSSTRASTRVQRTVTSANSAETKKALRAIMTNTPRMRRPSSHERDMAAFAACRGLLDLAPSLERARQRHLVRVFEVGAHRHPAGDAGHPHAERRQQARQVERRGLARHVGVGAEDDLGNGAAAQPLEQGRDAQVL